MEVYICIKDEMAEGNCLRGDCKMLKIIMVVKATVGVISLPNKIYVMKVKDIISGQLRKYKKTMKTYRKPLFLFEFSSISRLSLSLLKKYF